MWILKAILYRLNNIRIGVIEISKWCFLDGGQRPAEGDSDVGDIVMLVTL